MRSNIEAKLDLALTRHNETKWWEDSGINELVTNSDIKHHLFVVLATSVAEVGRDHDYDWAIVEPSSMRSIIQLAGRIQRHRKCVPQDYNIHILGKNFKVLKGEKPAYCRPGFESLKLQFSDYDLSSLIEQQELSCINAIPRIQKVTEWGRYLDTKTSPPKFKSFNALEHMAQAIRLMGSPKEKDAANLWWNNDVSWCGEIQRNQPFRYSPQAMEDYNINLSYDQRIIWQKKKQGEYPAQFNKTNDIELIKEHDLILAEGNCSWFEISITDSIDLLSSRFAESVDYTYKKFTHLQLRQNNNNDMSRWLFHPNLGVFKYLKKDKYIDGK